MSSQTSSNVENLSPQVIRQVSKELTHLTQKPLEGIRVILNEEDISDIQAIIDGPACTPYFGGSFRLKMVLPKDFPMSPPKGFFLTKIFHPNVSRNGEICVNTLKKDWKSDLGIKHILLTIKCLLIVPNPESALNSEAGKMLLEHYDDYCMRAKMMTEIHASKQPKTADYDSDHPNPCCSKSDSVRRLGENGAEESSAEPILKRHANDKSVTKPIGSSTTLTQKQKTNLKDKKRTLKRL
ncbi:ubiquitin-conjugating enzyme E2 S-like [Oppia nitens]|uniref:ubiquitin-conjugating enzyme E2 S-like n=1 Tax=Oppia nitens TaxID=1686743 RepID=UPI0023DCB15D|nr:ubiquitin-conjugating enzyme E2 S-like [Oppia nitens]